MKKHYLAIGAITATTLLAGCDLGDVIGHNNSSEKSEHTTTQGDQSSNKNTSKMNKSDSSKSQYSKDSVENLSQAEKVALALNDPSVSDYVINANELKNHSYFANYNGGGEQKSIEYISIKKYR